MKVTTFLLFTLFSTACASNNNQAPALWAVEENNSKILTIKNSNKETVKYNRKTNEYIFTGKYTTAGRVSPEYMSRLLGVASLSAIQETEK